MTYPWVEFSELNPTQSDWRKNDVLNSLVLLLWQLLYIFLGPSPTTRFLETRACVSADTIRRAERALAAPPGCCLQSASQEGRSFDTLTYTGLYNAQNNGGNVVLLGASGYD